MNHEERSEPTGAEPEGSACHFDVPVLEAGRLEPGQPDGSRVDTTPAVFE